MNGILDYLLNDLLTQPVLTIGLLIALGYVVSKKPFEKVVTGTISAMVGLQLVLFGGSQFSGAFAPITNAISAKFGIQGYLMDSYAMKAASQEALGDKFALVGYVFLIAFVINVVLVYFGKYTKAKGIFLTGNAGIAHSQGILWLVLTWLVTSDLTSVIIAGVLVGTYWAFSTTLAYKTIDKVTDGGGFTVGHNQQLGIWFFGQFADKFGNPETEDAENLNLPSWLTIFNNNVTATCLIMIMFIGAFISPLGISGIQELAGKTHWINYIIYVGINFSMYMVILLTGVRMMCSELTAAFKGVQEKIIPNAVPAIDVAAILPFSPTAATLGFIFCTIGTVISMILLLVFKSPIMVIPGFVPLFFAGGPIGVVANKLGGYKAVIVCCLLLGMIQSFGSVWAITLMNYPQGVGWSGMFDFCTFWPALTELLKMIGSIFA